MKGEFICSTCMQPASPQRTRDYRGWRLGTVLSRELWGRPPVKKARGNETFRFRSIKKDGSLQAVWIDLIVRNEVLRTAQLAVHVA